MKFEQQQQASEKDVLFWDKSARKYAASAIADEAGFERTLARTRDLIPAGSRVLELGCGTGTAALRLADAADSYLATDISGGMIAIAEEKLASARQDGEAGQLSFRQATANTLVNDTVRYDVIIGLNYLHLAGDLSTVLGHIRTLLAPGGLFISKTPCVGDMNPLIRLAIPVMRFVGKAPSVTVFSAALLEDSIRTAGFDIISCERHGSTKKDIRPFFVAKALE
ncbi:bifunctional 2-polyprenyl-6-hydroxyphenol methylase/3-demethylubiquinol 3-O-methyltransferase UbiG [Marinimicrobium sp. ABcell2]|uniref:class I SAM-dependent methyltransferase n=1 Tax=Marinimicrobium sp. ABcell2 TaxID=3069751 RepID=UPI0027B84484|nr:class I SAM-dependent methyltransferase [Marinimicrobium sp. ABcell2]MDQ2078413.1 class I SAM-dependent methyltransferase [Marinimicrobium sp. ABcell2]